MVAYLSCIYIHLIEYQTIRTEQNRPIEKELITLKVVEE